MATKVSKIPKGDTSLQGAVAYPATRDVVGLSQQQAVAYDTLKDKMGRPRTLSLFVENKLDQYPAPYTLKPYDHRGSMSMYRLYMEIADPTEYQTAKQLVGSWSHWQALVKCTWFQEFITKWREELKVKLESERYWEMREVVEKQANTPMGVQASKWLADRYGEKPKPKRGRPSKEEKKAHLKQEAEEALLLQEERDRLGL